MVGAVALGVAMAAAVVGVVPGRAAAATPAPTATWTEQHPATSPPALEEASMAYARAAGEVVLFGGVGSGGLLDGSWTYRVVPTVSTSPTNLTATAGNGQVDLSFSAPTSDGGSPITGYDVYEGTTSGGESSTPVTSSPLAPSATTYSVSGLTNGTTYYFTLKAINAVGPSPASNQASATPVQSTTSSSAWTAYVANFGSNSVTPIDTATNATGSAITVGSGPHAIAIMPDGRTAYVASYGSGTVTPIDTATNTAGRAIAVGSGPHAIAITPDGRTAYVANTGSGTVTPIDTATNTAGSPITVGTAPTAIAIAPDGATAYVANAGSNSVTPIDTTTNTAGRAITVGTAPFAIAITPDGEAAYVANYGSGTVTPIDIATNTTGTAIAVGGGPDAIAITPDQAPVAALSVSVAAAGSPSSFDASASTVSYGTITAYAWRFGDGTGATTTTPTTTHTYASPGVYTASVTETDSAGTSTSQVFTGQTMSRNGGPGAEATANLDVPSPPSLSVPGAPGNLTATAGNASVTLAWAAPASDGGSAITGYDVYEGTTSGGESSTPVNSSPLAPSATTYTVSGLTNGTTYYFTLKAINAVGPSPASNQASATPVSPPLPVNPPSAPAHLTASASSGAVDLSWSAPTSDGGSPITGYDVYEGTTSGGESSTPVNSSPLAPSATTYTVSGLTNGTTYYFTLKAINAVGPSPASNQASATPVSPPSSSPQPPHNQIVTGSGSPARRLWLLFGGLGFAVLAGLAVEVSRRRRREAR